MSRSAGHIVLGAILRARRERPRIPPPRRADRGVDQEDVASP
jgi:hypothetical protein